MSKLSLVIILGFSLLLAACSKEAVYIDHEFGMATQDAFTRQIINQDYAHAGKKVEGLPGIHAEPIMDTYQRTFSEGFTREDFDVSSFGVSSGSSRSSSGN